MVLDGIGIIDLDHQAEWAAAFLYGCHVEDRLYEWELVTDMNGRRVKFTFHGASEEWLYGVEQAWCERFPNVALEADHAGSWPGLPRGMHYTARYPEHLLPV